MHTVEISKERPDFRVFIDLLYGFGRNIDSEGNSNPVYSRAWTELYIKDRESDDAAVEIFSTQEQPSIFTVSSSSCRLEELAALYLFLTCGKSIVGADSKPVNISELKNKYSAELVRAANAVWHKSSPDLPYPNLA
jgi:hypothetical protein